MTINHTFGEAIEAAKAGKRIAREGWNGANMFAVYSPGTKELPAERFFSPALQAWASDRGGFGDIRPCFLLKTAQDDVAYWSPSGSDALATDWIILD